MTARFSELANSMQGSKILEISNQVRALKAEGRKILDFTVGDYNSTLYPIPEELSGQITKALEDKRTHYVPSRGLPALKEGIAAYYEECFSLTPSADELLIGSGARPLIYTALSAVINPNERLFYAVPSWNNHFYAALFSAKSIALQTEAESAFLPSVDDIISRLEEADVLCLNLPLNPTGTSMDPEQLKKILVALSEENKQRAQKNRKPCYLIFDQIYFQLLYSESRHEHPWNLVPEAKDFVIVVDGLSKNFCGTGLRLGWVHGPADVVKKMGDIMGHIGAWAATPVQFAAAEYFKETSFKPYIEDLRKRFSSRLNRLHEGIQKLKAQGKKLDSIAPGGAIYLSVKIDTGKENFEAAKFLLEEHSIALVPMDAFGLEQSRAKGWFRFSLGAVSETELDACLERLAQL